MEWLRRNIIWFALALVITGFIVLIVFLVNISESYTIISGSTNLNASSQTGEFVGGVVGSLWSLAGVLLFFYAIMLQQKELEILKQDLESNRIEMRNNNEIQKQLVSKQQLPVFVNLIRENAQRLEKVERKCSKFFSNPITEDYSNYDESSPSGTIKNVVKDHSPKLIEYLQEYNSFILACKSALKTFEDDVQSKNIILHYYDISIHPNLHHLIDVLKYYYKLKLNDRDFRDEYYENNYKILKRCYEYLIELNSDIIELR